MSEDVEKVTVNLYFRISWFFFYAGNGTLIDWSSLWIARVSYFYETAVGLHTRPARRSVSENGRPTGLHTHTCSRTHTPCIIRRCFLRVRFFDIHRSHDAGDKEVLIQLIGISTHVLCDWHLVRGGCSVCHRRSELLDTWRSVILKIAASNDLLHHFSSAFSCRF